jgi:hypothetical protein
LVHPQHIGPQTGQEPRALPAPAPGDQDPHPRLDEELPRRPAVADEDGGAEVVSGEWGRKVQG